MIDELDKFLGSAGDSLTVASMRPKFQPLREQAEAQEQRLRELESQTDAENLKLKGQVQSLGDELKLAELELGSLRNEVEGWR